jgi:predicted glycoside hydrolase/deacetylase ChbG (UPF0249 family)
MKREIVPVLLLVLCTVSWSAAAEETGRPIELCVRADDMGHTLDVNLAIIKAHTEGIVTSASLMVPAPYFDDAVVRCKAHPKLAAGIHTTLMAVVPMRPVLPPDQVPSLVAPDGYFHRGYDDFVKAQPKIEEVEKEIRAQIQKALDTGLRFVYIDSHMSSSGGKARPDIGALYPRLAREYRLLFTQDFVGQSCGARYFPANLETWGSQRLPDGTLVCYSGPDMPAEVRTKFLQRLQNLQPGTWFTVCHPGLYAHRQAQSTDLICSPEIKDIVRTHGIRLISFADLWNRKYGGKQP